MIRLIGLDFESSGANPWGESAPIQIGMNVWASSTEKPFDSSFRSFIGGWDFRNEWEWNEEAFGVHGIPQDRLEKAPRIHEVDVRAATWMYDNDMGTRRMWNVIVGWNVGGFDRQFVTRHMPNLNRLLSYRTLDLNAVVFSLAGGSELKFKKIKGAAKEYADNRIGECMRHDALTDARAALYEYEFLQDLAKGRK